MVPPFIADLSFRIPDGLAADNENALLAIASMDAEAVDQPRALARFMVRSESVASSRIERVTASVEDFARALSGNRSNPSALSMVAATEALAEMVRGAGATGRIHGDDISGAHVSLMRDDAVEGPYAGEVRDSQNWIGGSDHSPRNALYVPPAAERVQGLLDDLISFMNRDDLPILAQATIAHAQFESIHPFGDGNGRIGRALVGAILRRRGATRNAVVPIASGLLARRDEYFDALGAYRAGSVTPLLGLMLRSAMVAADEGRASVRHIKALPAEWKARSQARAGSSAARLIPEFFDAPVMSASEIEAAAGASAKSTYSAIERLEEEGIIHEITGRKRERVWVASDLMAELDELDARIAKRMR